MTDLADFINFYPVERALHGDLAPLVALLRSDERLGRSVRDYIANEIEQEPDKRFRRRRNIELGVRDRDKRLLYAVYSAKEYLAFIAARPNQGDDWVDLNDDEHEAVRRAQQTISDRAALDHLNAQGILDTLSDGSVEIDESEVRNARRRKAEMFKRASKKQP